MTQRRIWWASDGYTGQRIVGERGKTGEPVNVLAHPKLREILVSSRQDTNTLVSTRSGDAFTRDGWLAMFKRHIQRLDARAEKRMWK